MKNFNEIFALAFAAVAGGAAVVCAFGLALHDQVMTGVSVIAGAFSALMIILNGLSYGK